MGEILGLETRLVIAYALIAAIVFVSVSGGTVLIRQRARRKRRLRGIKSDEAAHARGRRAT